MPIGVASLSFLPPLPSSILVKLSFPQVLFISQLLMAYGILSSAAQDSLNLWKKSKHLWWHLVQTDSQFVFSFQILARLVRRLSFVLHQ